MKRKKLENDRRNNFLASINDPKRFWETLKSAKPIIQNDANYIDGEKWFAYFRNLFKTQERAGQPATQNPSLFDSLVEAKKSGCLNTPITEEEIMLSISSMKAKSAPGVDGICSEMFKCTANIVSKYLVCLFNEIFECGQFSDSWSENIISPIHK